MGDRKKLDEETNRINELYHEQDLKMVKAGGDTNQRNKLRELLNKKKEELAAQYGDDLTKLNSGKSISIKGVGKKLLGAAPLLGAGYAALQGDPAMAAEELAGDIPVVGQAYEAFKPDVAGDPNERQMLAEIQAQKNYHQSPAAADAEAGRLARLKAMMGKGK